MLRLILTLMLAAPVLATAALPYSDVLALQEAAEAIAKVDGAVCRVKIEHSRPDDRRPFRVLLESPREKTEIKVTAGGAFQLPVLPREDWDRSQLSHNLEKGALKLTFDFGFNGEQPDKDEPLSAMCLAMAEKMRVIEGLRDRLSRLMPGLADLQVAMVGVAFPRLKPVPGKVLLKRGDRTVAEIDLSQTGTAAWMFDRYDPKEHRMEWKMQKGEKQPRAELVLRSGAEATSTKNAILLWRPVTPSESSGSSKAPATNLKR